MTYQKKCILNENIQEKGELKNGLVNGIVHDDSNVKKSRRSKKNKHLNYDVNGESVSAANRESESESGLKENYAVQNLSQSEGKTATENETLEDQSSEHVKEKTENIINNVEKHIKSSANKKKCKLGKLDSNDNISTNASCDKEFCSEQQTSNRDSPEEKNKATDNHNAELAQLLKDKEVASCSNNLYSGNSTITDINFGSVSTEITDTTVVEITDSLRDVLLDSISKKTEISLTGENAKPKIDFIQYQSEMQMPMIMKIIQKDLSEPYSIYTYRYFIHNWPKLCFLAMCGEECVGAIVCKLDLHRKVIKRGYIAMLAVDQNYRKLHIGSNLVQMAINEMIMGDADEVVLETEVTNKPALQLYEKLGFVRDKRLFRYYLNGVDALRLKLWLR
ncbi:hypothetical protein NQ315_007559 [Exocentrus adspersus]|uniref:N-terminal methionine N(alpha)-acetyltransferase NatC n=1 Tax=Exocentrus adspersus TaxID=1586481 RepID=A0AAV8W839_9CUCU|nr:hypothetical protein NQ315_007559 [Exocentrus adspersus]